MNSTNQLEQVFPMAGGAADRVSMRAPRLVIRMMLGPSSLELPGDPTVLRSWASRRAAKIVSSPPREDSDR